jgi:hypothetical protein
MKTNVLQVESEDFQVQGRPVKVRINGKGGVSSRLGRHAEAPEPFHPVTVVEAHVDVGWGNTLFIRGEGGELNWDKGIPLACLDSRTWVWLYTRAEERVTFKLLINDEIWAEGDDLVLEPGGRVEIKPVFPSQAS